MEDLIVTPYDIDTTLGVEEVDERKDKKENNGAEFMQEMFQNEEFRKYVDKDAYSLEEQN